jgi:hypothetical protein
VPQPNGTTASPLKGLRKASAILGGLALCVCIALPCAAIGGLELISALTISTSQQQGVNWVLDHAYPNSTMVRADSAVSAWPAGNTVSVSVWVTFESADSFDAVKGWHMQHPEGGQGGGFESGNIFPQDGLEKRDGNSSNNTRYRVHYSTAISCESFLLGCVRHTQPIR